MRTFKTKWFTKKADAHGITDVFLCEAIQDVQRGLAIDLGGGVFNKNGWRFVMKNNKAEFRSPAFEAIHSAAQGLQRVGAISQETMRSFDESSLVPLEALQPHQIKALREQLHLSQPVFARYLNTSLSTIQKWESGAKLPGGPSLKLLSLVQKHGLKILL